MAYGGMIPGSVGSPGVGGYALKSHWDAVFRTKATEEMAIANDFDAPQGVDVVGDQLLIRIIPMITAQTLLGTAQADPTALNWVIDTILRVTQTPTFSYGAVSLPEHLTARLGAPDTGQLEAKYRQQLLAALNAAVDYNAGGLGPGISSIKGPGTLDKTQILDMQTTLATNSKNHVVVGVTEVNLKYHPSQIKYVGNIAEFANAATRGDAANPTVKGVILKAWGMTFAESGNINLSAGFYWNMMFAKSYGVLAWNQKPYVKPAQDYALASNIIGACDYCNVEVFDEDGVVFKSA